MIDVKKELRESFKRRGLTPPKSPYKPATKPKALLVRGEVRECSGCGKEINSTSEGEVICTACRSARAKTKTRRTVCSRCGDRFTTVKPAGVEAHCRPCRNALGINEGGEKRRAA